MGASALEYSTSPVPEGSSDRATPGLLAREPKTLTKSREPGDGPATITERNSSSSFYLWTFLLVSSLKYTRAVRACSISLQYMAVGAGGGVGLYQGSLPFPLGFLIAIGIRAHRIINTTLPTLLGNPLNRYRILPTDKYHSYDLESLNTIINSFG